MLLLASSDRELVERSFVDLADIVDHVETQIKHETVVVHAESCSAIVTATLPGTFLCPRG